ncbi:rhomboid family intramembrane serine protease [Actinotalea sp.]|uniref:rhomboid family intramembrane serine protease n=1 Tax=Actinotalea sp. TaxID=1872145 RepID=UPI003569EB7B
MTIPTPPSDAGVVPVCPRHPDRVAYVRCQRCGRPTCPECQRTAAVGVHCVDCVREAQSAVRPTTTVVGGRVRSGRPLVTYTLIGLNLLAFLVEQVSGDTFINAWVFAPFLGESEPWRFLTAAFLHSPSSLLHIGFNMYALWVLGQFLEPLLGRWRFTAAYLLAALGGSVMVLLLASPDARSWVTGVYGASGAVFGLFGIVLIVLLRLKRDARSILVVLAINAAIPILVPGISWQAHVGGFLVGLALGAAYMLAPKGKQRATGLGAVALTGAVLVVLPLLAYAVG